MFEDVADHRSGKMSLSTLVDIYGLEPLIRFFLPAPANRSVEIKTLQEGGQSRIICLCGAFCVDGGRAWSRWIRDFRRYFPETEVIVLNAFYYYWEQDHKIIEDLIAEGVMIVSDNRPTYVISFSFGGLIAKAIISRAKSHRIRAALSMATEHRGHLPRIAHMRDQLLKIPLDTDVPLFTFGGLFDVIVWPWTTQTEHSVHRFLPVGHFAFVRSPKARAKVLDVLRKVIANDRDITHSPVETRSDGACVMRPERTSR